MVFFTGLNDIRSYKIKTRRCTNFGVRNNLYGAKYTQTTRNMSQETAEIKPGVFYCPMRRRKMRKAAV